VIARFHILLPFHLLVPESEDLAPYEVQHSGDRVTVYPPAQAKLIAEQVAFTAPTSMNELITGLEPADPQQAIEYVKINQRNCIRANLLRLDFHRNHFDRPEIHSAAGAVTSEIDLINGGDPPFRVAIELANKILQNIRTLSRGCEVQMLDAEETAWRLDYLDDAGALLPKLTGQVRRRGASKIRVRAVALTRQFWDAVCSLGTSFEPPLWDNLLLDAEALLPDIDAAIALANSALEVFAQTLIDQLATAASLPPGLWEWINERKPWSKQPSTDDRYDALLKIFTGNSLREKSDLWGSYQALRLARNSFSHRGRPTINGNEVSIAQATELVTTAKVIVDWCESLLPKEAWRPKYAVPHEFFFSKNVGVFPTLPDS
jgi:hypothetical protein